MRNLMIGVQQGSLLSVLLFQLTINDLYSCLRYCTSILYADDTMLFLVGRLLRFLRLKLQMDLNNLSTWLKLNKLKLNVKKTKCMLFSKEGLNPHVNLLVDSQEISMVTSFKFLGVVLDDYLSFVPHFKELYDRLLKSTYVMKLLSKAIPHECLWHLYFAYFYSHVSYCSFIWYPMLSKSAQSTVQKVQKRAVRLVGNLSFRAHCKPAFKKYNILTIDDIVKLDNCKLYYRVANDLCAKPLARFFKGGQMKYVTCNSNMAVPRHSLSIINRSFLCSSHRDWLNVDDNIKTSDNVKIFRKKIKMKIVSAY